MLASCIVTVYNNEETIDLCLDSLLDLNYSQKEIIVIYDNGTKDNSYEIISKYPVKIIEVEHCDRTRARNIGIKNASGNIVLLVDADTLYDEEFLNQALKHFEDKNVAGIMGKKLVYNRDENFWTKCIDVDYRTRMNKDYVPKACWIYRKDLLEKVGFFDENILGSAEDVELAERFRNFGYKLDFEPKAIWFEIERASLRKEFSRYFQRGVGFGASNFPPYFKKKVRSRMLSAFYRFLVVVSLAMIVPLIIFHKEIWQFLLIINLLFLSPFALSSIFWIRRCKKETNDRIHGFGFKILSLYRDTAMLFGWIYGKIKKQKFQELQKFEEKVEQRKVVSKEDDLKTKGQLRFFFKRFIDTIRKGEL